MNPRDPLAFEEESIPGDESGLILAPFPPAPPAQPLTVWGPREFEAFTPDPADILLGDGIIERGQFTSLVGVGGIGKTRLALWLTVCQITGRDWCGIPTCGTPQTALILSTENGLRRWKGDLERMFRTLTEGARAAVYEHLRILALTPDEDGDLNLGNPTATERITATLRAIEPGLLVLDPFADLIAGDENKTADVVSSLATLRRVVRNGAPRAAVLVIHHSRTGAANIVQAGDNFSAGNFGRGSKALYSKVRAEIQLAPADRDDPSRLVLACGKANDAKKFATRGIIFDDDSFTYELDPSFDVEGWRADVDGKRRDTVVSIEDVVEAVREVYRPGEDVTAGAWVQPLHSETGESVRNLQRKAKEAVKLGYLARGKKRGTYRLGPKPLRA